MARRLRTPLGRVVSRRIELHAHQVLRFLYDTYFGPLGDPETPMTIPRIAAGIGLSDTRTHDACDFLIGKHLVAKRGSLRQYFYYITSDGVVYVDSSHPRSAPAPAVQPDSLAEVVT